MISSEKWLDTLLMWSCLLLLWVWLLDLWLIWHGVCQIFSWSLYVALRTTVWQIIWEKLSEMSFGFSSKSCLFNIKDIRMNGSFSALLSSILGVFVVLFWSLSAEKSSWILDGPLWSFLLHFHRVKFHWDLGWAVLSGIWQVNGQVCSLRFSKVNFTHQCETPEIFRWHHSDWSGRSAGPLVRSEPDGAQPIQDCGDNSKCLENSHQPHYVPHPWQHGVFFITPLDL